MPGSTARLVGGGSDGRARTVQACFTSPQSASGENDPYGYLTHLQLSYTPLTCGPDLPTADDEEGLAKMDHRARRLVTRPSHRRPVRLYRTIDIDAVPGTHDDIDWQALRY